ncbi:MAG: radical SAM protein [Spirochaetes bacterium]|nr:radical SAM protein [Spirochaetota bacterium]
MNGLRLIFWELTKRCNLRCAHCRAESFDKEYINELTTEQICSVIDTIASNYRPIIVLTGGEPLYRKDLFDIARYIHFKGLPIALATNGTLIDNTIAQQIKDAGFQRVSISIDGPDAHTHDSFRGIPGSFDSALKGAQFLFKAGVPFQFNTTITKRNVATIDAILQLAKATHAAALHVFMLVPVGCGVEIADTDMLSKEQYEEVLRSLYYKTKEAGIEFKATCAPHYYRIIRQEAKKEGRQLTFETDGLAAVTRGCLAGSGVCFISHRGDVQPCGYLPIVAGNVLQTSFNQIWEASELFANLRNLNHLKGKCGICEYKPFCAGCRARAYYETGDYMDEEPYCMYQPKRMSNV